MLNDILDELFLTAMPLQILCQVNVIRMVPTEIQSKSQSSKITELIKFY